MNVDLSDKKIYGFKYPNGNWKSQNFCDNNTRHGYQITWYENGQMKSAGDFNKGKPVGLHTLWHKNGNKRAEINYKDGKRNGGFIFWHDNTQVKFKGNYLSGEVVDVWTRYYPSGQKYRQTDTIKGKRLYWHENGQMKSRSWRIFYGAFTEYKLSRKWNAEGKLIDSETVNLIELKRYKDKTVEREAYTANESYAFFNKDRVKVRELDCNWEWGSSIHCNNHDDKCEEKDYLVTLNRFFDASGNVEVSVRFYEEGEGDRNPYAWCFYNSEDRLIYKYIINQETYSDTSLYNELLEIDNKELNALLIKCKDHKVIFDKFITKRTYL